MNMDTTLTIILFALNVIMLTMIIINMYRISKLRNHNLLDHAETKNINKVMKHYYRKIVIDKFMPLLIDYLNTFLENDKIQVYLHKNEKEIFGIIDTLIEKNDFMLNDLSDDDIKMFIDTLDIPSLVASIEGITEET